jgi:hypothetical protein
MTDDFNVIIAEENQNSVTISSSTAIVGQVTYTHNQSSAASSWVIVHNLGRRPSVTIVDSGGNVQIGDVLYNSDNQITVNFSAAFGGYAYLN